MNVKAMTKTAVEVTVEQRGVAISFDDVRRFLCPLASDAEIGLFLKVCQSENLNPFKKEIFLVKFAPDQAASIIIATEVFLKAAENSPEYAGCEAGIILKGAKRPEFREGSFLLDEEEAALAGGWAKVYRKDREKPTYAAVNIKEYRKFTKGGRVTRFWDDMPATMIRKVALSHALREAFPNRFAGTFTTAEVEEVPEGQLPPAYMKNGDPYWQKWWVRQKEKGLSEDDVHGILNVASMKEWLAQGRTLEEADDIIDNALTKRKSGTAAPAEAVGEQPTGAAAPAAEYIVPKPSEEPLFKTWGQLAEAAYKLGVTSDQVFKRAKVKKWEDFEGGKGAGVAAFHNAWCIVDELVREKSQKPKMM